MYFIQIKKIWKIIGFIYKFKLKILNLIFIISKNYNNI